MSTTRKRPASRNQANDKESTDTQNDSYRTASRGFAHWLEVAPSHVDWGDMVQAYEEYDSPHEVDWQTQIDAYWGDAE